MTKKTLILLCIGLIMVIAAFLRFYELNTIPPGLYPDVAMNGNNAIETLETRDPQIFYPENNGREGLFIMLDAGIIALFGNELWALRLMGAIFGILTVLGTYLLAKELFRDENNAKAEIIALIAAFFLATSFWHINFSRIGFRAIMAPFFLTYGFYFLWLMFRNNISDAKKTLAAAFGGLLFGAGFHSYIAYRIMPLLLLIPFIKIWRAQGIHNIGKKGCAWCVFTLFLFFMFVAVLPLGLYFLDHPQDFLGRTSQISIFDSENPIKTLLVNTGKTLGMFWFHGDGNWRHNFAGAPQLWWAVGILFAIGIIISIFKLFKSQITNHKSQTNELFLLFWIALGLLPVIFSNEGLPHALRAILIIPPTMILAGLGLYEIITAVGGWLHKKETLFPNAVRQLRRIKKELLLVLFLFFIAGAIHGYNEYFLRWAGNVNAYYASSGPYTELGIWIKNQPNTLKKYIIINAEGVPVQVPGSDTTFPMPSQTIMFITDSWRAQKQREKNITYLRPNEIYSISCDDHCIVAMLELDQLLRIRLQELIPGLRLSPEPGYLIFIK